MSSILFIRPSLALLSKISTVLLHLICLVGSLSASADVMRYNVQIQLAQPTGKATSNSLGAPLQLTIATLNQNTKETTQMIRNLDWFSAHDSLSPMQIASQIKFFEIFAQQLEEALNSQTISTKDLLGDLTVNSNSASKIGPVVDAEKSPLESPEKERQPEDKWSAQKIEVLRQKISTQKNFKVSYQTDLSTTLSCRAYSCESYKHFVITGPANRDATIFAQDQSSSTNSPASLFGPPTLDPTSRPSSTQIPTPPATFVAPEALAPLFESALNNKILTVPELQKLIQAPDFYRYMTLYPIWRKLSKDSKTKITFEYLDEPIQTKSRDSSGESLSGSLVPSSRLGRFTITSSALLHSQTGLPIAFSSPPFWLPTTKDLKSPQELQLLLEQALTENKIYLFELIDFLQKPDWYLRSSFRNYDSLITNIKASAMPSTRSIAKSSNSFEIRSGEDSFNRPNCQNIVHGPN